MPPSHKWNRRYAANQPRRPDAKKNIASGNALKQRVEVEKKRSRISVNSLNALCQMARSGLGLAVIPAFMAEPEVAAHQLQYVLEDWDINQANVYAVWPPNAPKDDLIKLFLGFLTAPAIADPD